ncbi:MAG: ATP synthase F1 subunit delta [Candidatus Omnitrophota bacterium]
MKNKLAAKRYAEAYVEFATAKIGIAKCIEDMKSLRTVMRDTPDFLHFLRAPEIPAQEKGALIDRVLGQLLADETRTFIRYLLAKGRIDLLEAVTDYVRVVYSHGEVVDVLLRTTFPLELDVIEKIKARVEQMAHKKANLYLELNPDLLGGVQILIGNTIIDGSVRNRLLQLKKQMLQAKVVP